MVKLASDASHKSEKRPSADHGFDNVPLVAPLEVDQLRHSLAEKVRTRVFRVELAGTRRRSALPSSCIKHTAAVLGPPLRETLALVQAIPAPPPGGGGKMHGGRPRKRSCHLGQVKSQ